MRQIAALLSLPTWAVIALAYANDRAWFAVTLIAPGLLIWSICVARRHESKGQ